MLSLATGLLLATTPPSAIDLPDRFDRARMLEAHRTLLGSYYTTRSVVNGTYHWATHNVALGSQEAAQQTREIGQRLEADRIAFETMTGVLDSEAASRMARDVTMARDALAKAAQTWTRLQTEAARPAPSRTEVRFLASEIYRAVAQAQLAQEEIGRKLALPTDAATTERVR